MKNAPERFSRLRHWCLCAAFAAGTAVPGAYAQHGGGGARTPATAPGEGEIDPDPRTWGGRFAGSVERRNGFEHWQEQEVLNGRFRWQWIMDIDLSGEFWLDTETRRLRIVLDDGTILQNEGLKPGTDLKSGEAWIAPVTGDEGRPALGERDGGVPGQELVLMSMPNLIALPFRLRSTQTRLIGYGSQRVNDRPFYVVSLNLSRDPDRARHHWYSLFTDQIHYRPRLIAFFANHDPEVDIDWEDQYAARLDDHERIDGVRLATSWTFWRWSRARGVIGDELGTMSLEELRFLPRDEVAFNRPEGVPVRPVQVMLPDQTPPDPAPEPDAEEDRDEAGEGEEAEVAEEDEKAAEAAGLAGEENSRT